MDTMIEALESAPFDQPELTFTSASDRFDPIHLDLWLRDADLVQPLLEYPEGRERDEFVRRALRIGILALQQAQARIDTDSVRREGEHFISQLGNHLIPNTTKNLLYETAGTMPIFCRASTIKFLWVSEAKNAFGLDKKSAFTVAFR